MVGIGVKPWGNNMLVRVLDDTIDVERHLFGLMDLDVESCPSPWPSGSMPPDVAVWPQINRIDFRSVGEDHVASVRLEAWDTAPAAPEGDWDDHEELEVSLSSGEVSLWTLTSGPSPSVFHAGPPGHRYAVHVWTRGQDEILRTQFDGDEILDGTEEYVLQFQPLNSR